MKIRPVGAELFLVNGQTDSDEANIAYCNSVNTPKNWKCQSHIKLKIDSEA